MGVVYKVDPGGQETVLHSFQGGQDGAYPNAGLVQDPLGNLFGTTTYGAAFLPGSLGHGTVYEITNIGQESVFANFAEHGHGKYPQGLVRDPAGNLYGITSQGGSTEGGVVFEVTPGGNETVLHTFQNSFTDGFYPEGGVVRDSSGNLYGTTVSGGASGYGTVYEVSADGTETLLYSFTGGADGSMPYAGLYLDSAGNLWGTTLAGGSQNAGVVFKIVP